MMRGFTATDGAEWTATVRENEGPDYKGRFYLVMTDADGIEHALTDIQWNNERTARRTLETMSETELRRRLRSARGRRSAVA